MRVSHGMEAKVILKTTEAITDIVPHHILLAILDRFKEMG